MNNVTAGALSMTESAMQVVEEDRNTGSERGSGLAFGLASECEL